SGATCSSGRVTSPCTWATGRWSRPRSPATSSRSHPSAWPASARWSSGSSDTGGRHQRRSSSDRADPGAHPLRRAGVSTVHRTGAGASRYCRPQSARRHRPGARNTTNHVKEPSAVSELHPDQQSFQDGRPAVSASSATEDARLLERAVYEVKKVVVGQDRLIEMVLVGLLSRGHILLEGVPGVAKTLTVETFARVVGGSFRRLQFTPDLVPADIVGTRIYRQGREEFEVELGPILANFVLADEINRAPAKVQSAL